MLGLQRGIVKLVPHHDGWAQLFAEEKERLSVALGGRARIIQHVGSTSVPDLVAKPVLDIAIAVETLTTIAECVPLLEAIDYTYFGDRSGKGDYLFVKGDERNRTHHLHMAEHTSPEWKTMLRFRDRLIADPVARRRYADLKRRLYEKHSNDRAAYTAGKDAFIEELLREVS